MVDQHKSLEDNTELTDTVWFGFEFELATLGSATNTAFYQEAIKYLGNRCKLDLLLFKQNKIIYTINLTFV